MRRPLTQGAARWLLTRLLGGDDATTVIGDLSEAHRNQLRRRTRLRAELAYAWHVATVVAYAVRDRGPRGRAAVALAAVEGERSSPEVLLFLHDLRFAIRALGRRWQSSLVAMVVIALGLGLNVAMFAVVRATVLSPFPYQDSDRLVVMLGTNTDQGWARAALSIPEMRDLAERSTAIREIGMSRTGVTMGLKVDDTTTRVRATFVDSAFFRALGTAPVRGRAFLPADDEGLGAHPVVVVSHEFWQSRLGGTDDVVGSSVSLSRRDYEVIGVMPAGLIDVANGYQQTDVWVPLTMGRPFLGVTMYETRTNRQYSGLLRLPAGTTVASLQSEIDRVMAELAVDYPASHQGRGARVWTLGQYFYGNLSTPLRVLQVGAALVLLICCVNVAAMMLIMTRGRLRELAVRRALGASRLRLVRQLMTETLLLAAGGGALGVLLAAGALRVVLGSVDLGLPLFSEVALDGPVLGVSIALLVAAAAASGLLPAWRFSGASVDLSGEARERGVERGGLGGRGIVLGEAAIAVMLLVGAALAAKSLVGIVETPTGFDTHDLVGVSVDLTLGMARPEDSDLATMFNTEDTRRRLQLVARIGRQAEAAGVPVGMIGPNFPGNANWHIRFAREGDVYVAYFQEPWLRLTINARAGSAEPAAIAARIREIVAGAAPNVVIDEVAMIEERMGRAESVPRLVATLSAAYATIAGLLAFVGTYGVLAYAVRSRLREIAVRAALGASRAQVLRAVFRQGMVPVLTGVVVGLLGALAAARLVAGVLYGVSGTDPVVYVLVAGLVTLAASGACLLPARRASRVDPAAVLRAE